jgi:aryl carrier-like protein
MSESTAIVPQNTAVVILAGVDSNVRMMRIAAWQRATGKKTNLRHGHK